MSQEDLDFYINLNYKMSICTIRPVKYLSSLKEVAAEKYDLKVVDMVYCTEEGEERPLDSEWDYVNMVEYIKDEKLQEIDIVIKRDEKTSEKRKESLRKHSSLRNEYAGGESGTGNRKRKNKNKKKVKNENVIKENEYERNDDDNNEEKDDNDNDDSDEKNNSEEDDVKMEGGDYDNGEEEMGMQCDYDYFGDTRNRKGMVEEGYTNQNKGFKEQKRIYYIKEKKDKQRMEDLKKNEEQEEEEDEEEMKKKSRKRALKKTVVDDEDLENNCSDVPDKKNNKKKKKPKKDRVRF